jgi:large exoprotein involved in heme utilization and adhesion
MGPNTISSTIIASSSVSTKGNAGNITINTPKLVAQGGALISSSTFGEGNAGFINLNISESIEIIGSGLNNTTRVIEPTAIRTAGVLLPESLRKTFGLPDRVMGSSGGILINTPNLEIARGALLSVNHDSLGNAGKILINANSLKLDLQGKITASTASGEGGNITLNLGESLILRNESFINAEARRSGNGGNIQIDAPIIVGLENSDIIANAQGGRGGNINIKTQDIIGLKFRNTLTPRTDLTNDITTSSEFSINGNVSINMVGIDPNSGLVSLPVDLTDASRQIADRCGAAKISSFIATGRGGMPQNPMKKRGADRPWHDLRPMMASNPITVQPIVNQNAVQPLLEASAIEVAANGEITLVAPQFIQPPSVTCAPSTTAS